MAETYVAIFEEAFRDKGAVHAYLASSLDFPDWYGNNLSRSSSRSFLSKGQVI